MRARQNRRVMSPIQLVVVALVAAEALRLDLKPVTHKAAGAQRKAPLAPAESSSPLPQSTKLLLSSESLDPIHAADFANDGIVYLDNLLTPRAFNELQRLALGYVSELQPETQDTVAKGRLGAFVPGPAPFSQTLTGEAVTECLRRVTGAETLEASDFPVEIRRYPVGSSMAWHCDEALYEEPQIECVYTLFNTSDSETQWETRTGAIYSRWMKPNSLLVVKANGPNHRVKPVTRGERLIAKFVYTSCPYKLPSWYANLDAYRPNPR